MDSTPVLPQLQPLAPSAAKLPIKRKAPFSPHEQQFFTPKLQFQPITLPPSSSNRRTPPFKFHRVWTENDEISFLHGLLQSQEQGLSFPKDLPIFYSNFTSSISQLYTKSQLSEKLRRLRKKFRVVSSRLARGLNPSDLSPHDQTLFDLSKRLWSSEFSSISPFGNSSSGFNLGFSMDHENHGFVYGNNDFEGGDMTDNYGEPKVNVNSDVGGEGIHGILAKSVLNVFDECFKEFQMAFEKQGVVWMDPMERRWKEQMVSELDAFGRRLRLVMEKSMAR